MDPCECLSQEVAMRRLLNMLRESQTECTDTQCFDELPGPDTSNYVMTALFFILAIIVYMMRPRSTSSEPQKVPRDNQGPLPPPDAIN